MFVFMAGVAAAFVDADVFRAVVRRIGFLDRAAVLDDDVALQQRIETLFADLRTKPQPAAGPPRDELVRIIADCREAEAK